MTVTDERLHVRLAELRREYALGEGRMRDLAQQQSALKETLLRISGAIQVLEELAAAFEAEAAAPTSAPDLDGEGPQLLPVPDGDGHERAGTNERRRS